MPTTKLLLIRHGETDDNKNRVFQGQAGRGLNPRGRDQAARLAARLQQAGVKPHALYASDLERALETAQILGQSLDLSPTPDPSLREVYLGAWQGLTHEEISRRFPDEWTAWRNGVDIKRGGGESYAEVTVRIKAAIDRITQAHPASTIAIVSHGGAIKSFVAAVLGLDHARISAFSVAANTAVNLIERDHHGRDRLVVWNDASHLYDPLAQALGALP